MHQSHMTSNPPHGQVTPPHQIHNPTPAYHHPNFSTAGLSNTSPPASSFHHHVYHSGHQLLANDTPLSHHHSSSHHTLHSMQQHHHHQQQHQQPQQHPQDRNDSPTDHAVYANQHHAGPSHNATANMPPTPNSLLTMVGPHSGNSNHSNDAGTPNNNDTCESSLTNTNNNNNNNHLSALPTMNEPLTITNAAATVTSSYSPSSYSAWTSVVSRPMAQMSPVDMHPGALGNSCPPQMAAQPMHHHIASGLMTGLHHSGSGSAMATSTAPYMHQQSLPNFCHSAAKNYPMPPPHQSFFWQ